MCLVVSQLWTGSHHRDIRPDLNWEHVDSCCREEQLLLSSGMRLNGCSPVGGWYRQMQWEANCHLVHTLGSHKPWPRVHLHLTLLVSWPPPGNYHQSGAPAPSPVPQYRCLPGDSRTWVCRSHHPQSAPMPFPILLPCLFLQKLHIW